MGFPSIDKTILINICIRCAKSFWYLCLICNVIQVCLYLLQHSGFVTVINIKSNMHRNVSLCLLVRDQEDPSLARFMLFYNLHVTEM